MCGFDVCFRLNCAFCQVSWWLEQKEFIKNHFFLSYFHNGIGPACDGIWVHLALQPVTTTSTVGTHRGCRGAWWGWRNRLLCPGYKLPPFIHYYFSAQNYLALAQTGSGIRRHHQKLS